VGKDATTASARFSGGPGIRATAPPDRLLSSFINGIKHVPCGFAGSAQNRPAATPYRHGVTVRRMPAADVDVSVEQPTIR
jgi:hypothetical protein